MSGPPGTPHPPFGVAFVFSGTGLGQAPLRMPGANDRCTGAIAMPPSPSARRAAVSAALPPVIAVLALVALWSLLAAGQPPIVLPGPVRVLQAAIASWSSLRPAIAVTLLETALGLGLALALAVPLAMALAGLPPLRRALQPLLVASQTVQVLAVAPLLVMWFGFGLTPKVLVVALACFFPLAISLADGLAGVDRAYLDLFASLGARPPQTWRLLRLPAALPAFFSGLKIAVTYGIVSATIGEWVGGSQGLGLYMLRSRNALRIDQVFAGMLVTTLLSMALYGAAVAAERRAMPWRRAS